MNKIISCTTGIYDSKYTLTCHKDGSVTVLHPYIKWVNNSGSLAYCKTRVYGKKVSQIKKYFESDELIIDQTILDELL